MGCAPAGQCAGTEQVHQRGGEVHRSLRLLGGLVAGALATAVPGDLPGPQPVQHGHQRLDGVGPVPVDEGERPQVGAVAQVAMTLPRVAAPSFGSTRGQAISSTARTALR